MSIVPRLKNHALQNPHELIPAFYCLISFYFSSNMLSLSTSQSLWIYSPFGLQHTFPSMLHPIFAFLYLCYPGVNSNTTSSERHHPSKAASTPSYPCSVALACFYPLYCSYWYFILYFYEFIIGFFPLKLQSPLGSFMFTAVCLHLEQHLAQSKCWINIHQITDTQM